jgi:hypothetical protein
MNSLAAALIALLLGLSANARAGLEVAVWAGDDAQSGSAAYETKVRALGNSGTLTPEGAAIGRGNPSAGHGDP